ncbi:myotubularin-related protein 11 isoform X2 [Gopherus flavomarginatus]|uniref:myotubularin-related protein 11 isoform X2 n=1 Tax=Gopherus flavomarginatus TaxID=286002 RepID=UPI0021CC239A|nr:myotubularin-related protein 11 isoform X2 [Gopherus flavomarginatus]
MLSGSKNSFKIQQHQPGPALRGPKSSAMNSRRNRNCQAFPCIPGEHVLEAAAHVRKIVRSRDGEGSVLGTLYCTNLRVAFVPEPAPGDTVGAPRCSTRLHSEHDVALLCIRRLVAVNSFTKAKVLTASSTLKFIPEELVLYCRDFRVLRFRFHDSGLEPRACQVTLAIVQAQESSRASAGTWYDTGAIRNLENAWLSTEESSSSSTLLFERPCDWEKELRRLGAAGWRVSAVNERFDMATSLPKYLWVPSRLLDNELKRAFGHFNARRIPRLCWHHPGGSDLLRAAGFHADSDPEKEDVRSVEALMLAGHAQCVIVETAADLPSPAEIQLSYLKLRALCLPDSSVADEKWLSALEGTRWLEHVRACVRKACEVAVLLAERSRSIMLQESDDRDLNCLLASLIQVLSDPHTRTQFGFQSLLQKEWVVAGHPFLQRLNLLRDNDREESPVFLLFLDCMWQLLQQFPASFEFTETYLLALHDSSYIPFFSTFLFNCQWERDRRNQHRASNQIYAPVNGWREPPPLEILQKGGRLAKERGGPYLPTIWDWALRYTTQQRAQFRNPAYARSSGSTTVPNGKSAPLGGDKLEAALSGNGTMYLFAKGALSPQTHLFPWKNGSLSKKGWWRAQSSESLSEQDRSLRSSPSGCPLQPEGLLLPASVGPLIQLWRRCYLRGSQEVQRGLFASTLSELAEELDLLRGRLTGEGTC